MGILCFLSPRRPFKLANIGKAWYRRVAFSALDLQTFHDAIPEREFRPRMEDMAA